MRLAPQNVWLLLAAVLAASACGISSSNKHDRGAERVNLRGNCWKDTSLALTGTALLPGELLSLNLLGEAHVFPERTTEGAMRAEPLRRLVGDGTLATPSLVAEPLGFEKTESSDHVFRFTKGSDAFRETTAFTYANRMLTFLSELDPQLDIDCDPITVSVVGQSYGTIADRANAAYTPSDRSESGKPLVTLGPGDGGQLGDLAVDFDAVAHEVAHHMIFQYLPVLRGDAVVLHEGLADFFVFAATDDACLGESVKKSCLRSGENALVWGAADLPGEPHTRGQVFSGFLWDLAAADGLGAEQVAILAIGALRKLDREPEATAFAEALLEADAELCEARHRKAIRARACARGIMACAR